MKILIIRLSSIGDIVLTSPVLRYIKKAQPKTQIHYLTKPAFAALLKNNSYIDKIHEYNTNITTDLIQEQFDYIIDLQNNFRTLKMYFLESMKYSNEFFRVLCISYPTRLSFNINTGFSSSLGNSFILKQSDTSYLDLIL